MIEGRITGFDCLETMKQAKFIEIVVYMKVRKCT